MTSGRIALACLMVLVAGGPLVLPDFYITLLNYIGLYSIVALALVLLTGVAGLTSFGHAAFVGIGAYTTAVLTTTYGVSPWLSLPVAIGLTSLAALILGLLTLRLSGHYFVVGTIAWGISLYFVFGNLKGLGGYNGIPGIPGISILGFSFEPERRYTYLIWSVTVTALVSIVRLLDSRPGRAIRSLRSATMAEAFGVHTWRLKIVVFVYSALLAGGAGWLHAHYLRFVNPTPFGVDASIEYLFMIVVGGAAEVWGALVGAGVITIIKSWLQDVLPKLIGSAGQFEVIVFGIAVVLILHNASGGIMARVIRMLPDRSPVRVPQEAPALARRPRAPDGQILLEVDRACKVFGGLTAVNNVEFGVKSGEIVGLIGPNGAGKTTLFNLISGTLPLTSGQIRFRGYRIDRLPSRAIVGLGIARTFQLVRLRSAMTLVENVALGAHTRSRSGVISAIMRFDRREEAKLMFEAASQIRRVGLDRYMHDVAGNLPLGQQRVGEIARALAANPLLMLLDEPGAGLRHQEKQDLARLIRSLRDEGVSILLVEHDMELVMGLVDRLVVMDFGEKIAEGSPQMVRRDSRVIEAYLGT
jgi:ABC-type branched-subunit amino acid transport system ATPase component/ABC-type branched-subunit amino acid transport system permease subunit